jgi:hypothetical protein
MIYNQQVEGFRKVFRGWPEQLTVEFLRTQCLTGRI